MSNVFVRFAADREGTVRGSQSEPLEVRPDDQAITALAVEHQAPISIEEFQTLNRCLDTAIADAVTEHARVTAEARSAEENERLGRAAHELRDVLNTAVLAFHTLKRGAVAINGSTGAVLGRSLMSLRELIDRTLSEVRLAVGEQRRARLPVVATEREGSTGSTVNWISRYSE